MVSYCFDAQTKGKAMSNKYEYEYEWKLEQHVYYSARYNGTGFDPPTSDIEASYEFNASRNNGVRISGDELPVLFEFLEDWHDCQPSENWVPIIKHAGHATVGYEISLQFRKFDCKTANLVQQGYAYVDQSNWQLDTYFVDARDRQFRKTEKRHQRDITNAMADHFSAFRNLSNAYELRQQSGHTHHQNELNQLNRAWIERVAEQ